MKLIWWTVTLLVAGLCSSDLSAQGADASPSPKAVQQALDRLLRVNGFAFGGVGFAGATSEGEKAFKTVLASTNALRLFQSVLLKGSNEAKLYALTGLRQLSPAHFDADAKPLLDANPEVTIMSGCIVDHQKAAAVIKRIAGGTYDRWTTSSKITIR